MAVTTFIMDYWLISVPPAIIVMYISSRVFPPQFKLLGRFLIALPLGMLFCIILLGIFDLIHHIVGLLLHVGLKFFLWLFYRYGFDPHIWEYWEHFKTTHPNKLRDGVIRHQDSGHMVAALTVSWFATVTIFFVQECKRVTFKEAFKTVLRDQVYILDNLYRFLSGLIEFSLGKFVRISRRFVSDKQMQEAIKKAAQKATADRFES